MKENVNRVVRVEHHWLPTCPCGECVEERGRRERAGPANKHVVEISPDGAFALGLTTRINPNGSVAGLLAKGLLPS